MDTYNRQLAYERSIRQEAEAFPDRAEYAKQLDSYGPVLIRHMESMALPQNLTAEEAALGYAERHDVTVRPECEGNRTPQEVVVSHYSGENGSDMIARPKWSDETPAHLRQGWSFDTREIRGAMQWLDNDDIDPETKKMLHDIAAEQTDALSVITLSAVTGGAVLPATPQQQIDRAV